jgi:hypothetical protein
MMPKKLVIDCSTGVESEIDLTSEEIAQAEIDAARWAVEVEAKRQAAEAQAVAKASAEAKLAALGLTAEEIAAL